MRHAGMAAAAVLALTAAGMPVRAGSLDDLDRDLRALAEKVTPSVVTVTSEVVFKVKPGPVPGWPIPDWPVNRVTASGVIYDQEGHIVTVASTVPPGRKVTVTLADGTSLPGKLVGRDLASNIAVLKVEAERLAPAAWGTSADVRPGSVVVVVGSSFGMGPSVTLGLVSAVGRSVAGHADLIQITAPVNPGDSGGMLANAKGEVVGIVTATFARAPSGEWLEELLKDLPERLREWRPEVRRVPDWFQFWPLGAPEASDGSDRSDRRPPPVAGADVPLAAVAEAVTQVVRVGSQGMNYALPADEVKLVVDQLIKRGKVARGWLGVMIEERRDNRPGLVVADVVKGSPAAKAGIRVGDRILAVGGVAANSFAQLSRTIARRPPGADLEVRLLRDGREVTVTATLTEKPGAGDPACDDMEVVPEPVPVPPPVSARRPPLLGIQFQPLTRELAEFFGVKDGKGVLVAGVVPDSPAAKAGLQAGDCIVAVQEQAVTGGDDFHAAIAKHAGRTVTLRVVRDRKALSVAVELPAAGG